MKMHDVTLLPVKPGTLSAKDKAALSKAGVVVIEHEDPSSIRLLKPGCELSSTELLVAAMRGVMRDNGAKIAFADNFTKFLEAAWERSAKP
jgi:hypothetical protein